MSTEQEQMQFFEESGETSAPVEQPQQRSDTYTKLACLAKAVKRGELDETQVHDEILNLATKISASPPQQPVAPAPTQTQVDILTSQIGTLTMHLNATRNQLQQLQNAQQSIAAHVAQQPQQQQQPVQPVQQSTALLQNDIKIELPAKFHGDVPKLRSWIFNVQQYGILKGLSQQQLAAVAVTLLAGKAAVWWETQCAVSRQNWQLGVLSFDDLKAELEVVFGDDDRERKLLTRFQQFSQRSDLATYISSFRSLRLELGTLITNQAALWQFIGGLKVELKREVMRERSLTTLSDAILAAERAEAVEKYVRYGTKPSATKPAPSFRQNDGPVPMEIDTMQGGQRGRGFQRGGSRFQPTSQQQRGRGFKQPTRPAGATDECYFCGKRGHYARDCFQKQRGRGRGQTRVHNMHSHVDHEPATSAPFFPPPPSHEYQSKN